MGARYLLEEDVVTLLNASDSEDISEEENHTSDDSIHRTSESDCDTSDSEDDRKNVQSKDRKITWSEEPFPQHGTSSANNQIDTWCNQICYLQDRCYKIFSSNYEQLE